MGKVTRTNFGWTVTRRLTNAEILTLFTAPITLVAARANVIWVPLSLSLISETTAGAYATVANFYLGTPSQLSWFFDASLADSQLDSGDLGVYSETVTGKILNVAVTDFVNAPLLFSANADPTGGDVANYAIVTVEGRTLVTV